MDAARSADVPGGAAAPTGQRCLAGRSCLPSTAVLEMTFACNHQCLYCSCPWDAPRSAYPRDAELAPDEWRRLLTSLTTEHDCCNLAFTGGETLLKEGLEGLLRHAAGLRARFPVLEGALLRFEERRPELFVLSNGRALDDRWLDLFAELGVRLSLSLPGLRTFARHTGNDAAPRVLGLMRRAADRGLVVTANVTVTKLNLPELYETLAEAFLHGATQLLMNRFMPGGRGLGHLDELLLTGEQVLEMCDVADEVLVTADRHGSLGTELPACVVRGRTFKRLKVGTRCSAAKEFFVVDPAGWIRACNHSPVRILRWPDVAKLPQQPYWRRFVERDYLPDACFGCDLLTGCDGGCREAAHVQFGSVTAPDPLWRPELVVKG